MKELSWEQQCMILAAIRQRMNFLEKNDNKDIPNRVELHTKYNDIFNLISIHDKVIITND